MNKSIPPQMVELYLKIYPMASRGARGLERAVQMAH